MLTLLNIAVLIVGSIVVIGAVLYSVYLDRKLYKKELDYLEWRNNRVDDTFDIAIDLLVEATNAIRAIEEAHSKEIN